MRLCAAPVYALAIAAMVGLSAGHASAQKTERQVQDEYRKNITRYIQDLDDNFAIRYVDQEHYLVDLITVVYNELMFRKKNNIPRTGVSSIAGLPSREEREALKTRVAEQKRLLNDMKKQNRLLEGYNSRAALHELHLKYQKAYAEDFEWSKMEVQGIRQALIAAGQPSDAKRMFENQLSTALRRYKEESFSSVALQLQDLYDTYHTVVTEWDDILYYLADCHYRLNDFSMAEKSLVKIITDFSGSPYAEKAYTRLIAIAYIEGNRTKMIKYFGDFEAKAAPRSTDDARYSRAVMMAATTFFRNSDYTSAINALEKIPPTSIHYYPARYLMAHCYAGQESFSAALEAFGLVIKWPHKVKRFDQDLRRQLRHLSMLKSGLIKYEQNVNGLKFRNVYPEVRVIPKDSEFHDAALLASAWAAFKDNNVDTARILIDSLIRNFPASDHIFEAKTLIGNIEVLDPRLSDKDRELLAIDAYDYVAKAMEAKYLADQFIVERDSITRIMDQLAQARALAGLRGDSVSYLKYEGIHQILEISLVNNGFTRAVKEDARSTKFYQTVSNLISEVRVTEGKMRAAQEAGNQKEADVLQTKLDDLLRKLQEMGGERYISIVLPGLAAGESNDVEAVLSMRNDAIDKVRQKAKAEKGMIETRLNDIERLIRKANQQNNVRDAARLEEQKAKLNEAYTQVVEYERWASNLEQIDPSSLPGSETAKSKALGDEFTSVTLDNYSNIEIQNYFTLHKMSRVISEIEARNRSVNALRDRLSREKDMVKTQIGKVDALIAEARAKNNRNALLKLQFERNRLADLHGRIGEYEVSLLAQDQVESYADLDVWGDFAIYGRNNITYVINTTKIETMNDLSRAISQIDRILLTRKKNYEHRIAVIEEEIKRKEQEIRDKELQEIRASQRQYYEKEFFQVKASEKPEADPYDYVDLVPEVIDIKAIEDSLKKLEIPIVEKPAEEEYIEDTTGIAPVDTTGLQETGGASTGGTDTGSEVSTGISTGTTDTAATGKTDVETPVETKSETSGEGAVSTATDTAGTGKTDVETPVETKSETSGEGAGTTDSVGTRGTLPADTSGTDTGAPTDTNAIEENGGGGGDRAEMGRIREIMGSGLSEEYSRTGIRYARKRENVLTTENC